jgi:hypothetical protein
MDSITDVIPSEFEIDIKNRIILNTYFLPQSEVEYKQFEGYIVSFVELINKTLTEEYTHIYTFIETSTYFIIDESNMSKKFNIYKKNNTEKKSDFSKMIKFIDDNLYHFDQNDYLIINFIDKLIRKIRNDVVHKFYESKEREIISEILPDNKNVEQRLRGVYSYFLDNINCIYEVTHNYISIISKVLPMQSS